MSERRSRAVPAEVDDLPAGAALATALEGMDPARVSPHDAVRLARAHRRQLSHQQAMFSRSVLECALANPDAPGGRTETVGPHGADELRAVLHESDWVVGKVLDRGEFARRWPAVAAAWDDGSIDQERVRILERWTAALSAEHRAQVLRIVVPEAGELTLKKLIERIEQVARDLDPEWAKNLYDEHKRQRRVRARRTEVGTVNLSGLDLGLDDGAVAERNVTVMAARAKALGHPGLVDTIEADVYLALLKPRPPGWTDDDLIASVVAAANPTDPPDPRPAPEPSTAPADGAVPGDPLPTDPGPTDPGSSDFAAQTASHAEERRPSPTEPTAATGGLGRRWPQRARLALRVGLGTLLGLDRRTARMPGYGVVHAELARILSRAWADAEWRIAIADHTGALSAVLTTAKRPVGWATVPTHTAVPTEPAGGPAPPRPIVVIHATEDELQHILDDPVVAAEHPEWADLLTDLRRQRTYWSRRLADTDLTDRPDGPVDLGGLLADLISDPSARFPSAAQRRWVEERNQTCTYPPCGADALHTDIDHTRARGRGGPTLTSNLGPACGRDNRLKEQSGWWVEQPRPGHFVWHSNTGHAYPSRPTGPVPDHAEPVAFAVPSSTIPREYADNCGAWTNEPYLAAPQRPPPPPTRPFDAPPPF